MVEYTGEYAVGSKAVSKQNNDDIVTIEDILKKIKNKCWEFIYSYDNYCNYDVYIANVYEFEEEFELLVN